MNILSEMHNLTSSSKENGLRSYIWKGKLRNNGIFINGRILANMKLDSEDERMIKMKKTLNNLVNNVLEEICT